MKSIKVESLRVHAPTTVVFLCGGAIDPALNPPRTLRDAFYRIVSATAPSYEIVLAEDADPLTTEAGYSDLFRFESDIAQLVGLILLFAESAGSLAELGAFAALDTVSPRLLAVLDDFYYDQVSFIRNGPVLYLENEHGEEWIIVLDRAHSGISSSGTLEGLKPAAFSSSILPVIENRLANNAKWSKFKGDVAGHVILLITGLCQEYGALTISEIRSFLSDFGIKDPRLSNFIYCAQLLGWLRKKRIGHHIFYVATAGDAAIDYVVDGAVGTHDKVRWRADVRAFWEKNDPPRLRAITEARTPGRATT